MSLTRAMLKGMGLTEEQVSAIIDEHTSVTNGLITQRDAYKKDSDKLATVQKELEDLKTGGDDWKEKYEKEHQAFEDYKADALKKEQENKIKTAYKQLLLDNNVGEKHINSILRVTDFTDMKLNKDGTLSNEEKLTEAIKEDWGGFIGETKTKGAEVGNPPAGSGAKMSKEDIMKIKDSTERQKAIAENHELFGF